ncbi:uncharacterized protein N7496_007116 [Penicillium cataractarum]|uniref:C2H2-type domain-containing protein n=1 Tax=Penicillium cataractarum TaxID=2100454 RepID=A0A9W9S4U9_9EURO|nr:uncharacterized protein N7496_007116 [Penicillium cataractarum]KAJ5371024.1 hypothetical protein N7496_007116 [Penicillium cataractarum]
MADQLQTHQVLPSASQPGGDARETIDAVNTAVSISSLVLRCFGDFQSLIDALSTQEEQSPARSKVSEELGRLRVWVGNFGAHRKQTDRLSLDHRLREAPDLHKGVRNHLADISKTIEEASAYLLTSPGSTDDANLVDREDSDSESSDSDGFWEQIRTEASHRSPIDIYIEDLSHTVTSLYKLSLSLQNPAHRDRSIQASRIDLHHFEFYDINHVCDKFNLTPDSALAQRLGKANTKRRQLLAYYKDHSDKISKYVNVAISKAVPVPQLPVSIELQSEHQRRPPTISTQWTQDTMVSTIYQDNDVASDSGRTRFSATSSTAGDQVQNLIPPPPRGSSVTRRHPFICPYCHQTVQVENDEDWIYHVYSDLRPYICTFGGCVKENQLYDSFTEWSAHERQFHRREWFCTLCPYTSADKCALLSHLEDDHADTPKEQRQEMKNQSKPSTLAQQCPLCTKPPITSSSRFQQHLAQHLQQLALFVLPRRETDDEESALREEESDESRQAFMTDLEDRGSLDSIYADSKASVVESSTSGLRSLTNDRLLDEIPVEAMNDTSEGIKNESDDTEATNSLNSSDVLRKMETHALAALENSRKDLGPENPHTIACMDTVAFIYWDQWRLDDLEPFLEELLDIKQRILGPGHESTIGSIILKGQMLIEQSRLHEAEKVFELGVQISTKHLGMNSEISLNFMNCLARTYRQLGKIDQSDELVSRLREISSRALGEDHPITLWTMHIEAMSSHQTDNDEEKERLLSQIVESSEKLQHFQEHRDMGNWARVSLVQTYFNKGETERAEEYLRMTVGSMKDMRGNDRHRMQVMGTLANICFVHSRLDVAEALSVDARESATKAFGQMNAYRARYGANLARVYYRKQRVEEARQLMAECAEDLLKCWGPRHPETIAALKDLQEWEVPIEATNAGASQTLV